jgi:16S rRNA (uracil1498-N3)-methyltransferase
MNIQSTSYNQSMRLNRFIGNFALQKGIFDLTDPEINKQIRKVLRLGKGEKIVLCDGRGSEAIGIIISLDNKRVALDLENPTTTPAKKSFILLYCSVLKRENFELVVQKATEVGVSSIIPIVSERTVKQNINLERLNKIAEEAAEQSGRCFLPAIEKPLTWPQALAHAKNNDVNIFFEIGKTLTGPLSKQTKIGIFIGPEGGWSSKELETAKNQGFLISGLGDLVLRAETAAIVASYLACQN